MSVLVDWDMPKACRDCSLQIGGYCQMYSDENRRIDDVNLIVERPDWCPLVEIPTPHGRLGDLDKLNIHDISPVDGFCVMGVTEEDIELADTVIEAEGET